jgi:hypothetical protein
VRTHISIYHLQKRKEGTKSKSAQIFKKIHRPFSLSFSLLHYYIYLLLVLYISIYLFLSRSFLLSLLLLYWCLLLGGWRFLLSSRCFLLLGGWCLLLSWGSFLLNSSLLLLLWLWLRLLSNCNLLDSGGNLLNLIISRRCSCDGSCGLKMEVKREEIGNESRR